MKKCECGKKFENKAGLVSHQQWCDGNGLLSEQKNEKIQLDEEKEICDYGCGSLAKWKLVNGKYCCSENTNSCPAVREKNSESIKKLYSEGKLTPASKVPEGEKFEEGNVPVNKGKSYKEAYGEKKAAKMKKKIGSSTAERFENYSETELKNFGKAVSEGIKESNKKIGGNRKKSGISNGCWYNSDIAGAVWLDSSYELAFAKWLDKNFDRWKRNKVKFEYLYEDEKKSYIPDFYLPDKDLYIEIKGFKTKKDEAKWRDFPEELKVLYKEDLIELGCNL
jgi:hypothetical protein